MKKPYQDQWRDGRLVQRGRRECAARYAAIRAVLERELGRGFRVADVGGWDGYFPRRLAEDLGAAAVNVDSRPASPGVSHQRLHVTADNVGEIGEHDAILLLSVLHHMPDWEAVYESLKAQATLLIVEVCHPDEALGDSPVMLQTRERICPQYERIAADASELVCESVALDPPHHARPTLLVRCAARGTVEKGKGRAAPLMADEDWSSLGYAPYPGTLNLNVGVRAHDWLESLPGVEAPGLKRSTHYVPVRIAEIDCHVHFSRAKATVELVAPVCLRDALDLNDGDRVTVRPR